MKANNMSKSKANKLARKNALIAKAASNASKDSPVEEKNVTTFVKEDDSISSELNSAFKTALNKILDLYPASANKKAQRSDFSSVLSILLKLNIDIESPKAVNETAEKVLNSLGFTTIPNSDEQTFITKLEIPQLVLFIFDGYQKEHPSFCAIDNSIITNCSEELDAISQKVWHPVLKYLVCQTAGNLTETNAKLLISNDPENISIVLKTVKCAEQTKIILAELSPYIGKIYLKLEAAKTKAACELKEEKDLENIRAVNCPFSGLNPADFPEFSENEKANDELTTVTETEDKKMHENHATSKEEIVSKQKHNLYILNQAVYVLDTYGSILRELETIGFSITDLLNDKKSMDTLKCVITALQ